MSTTASSANRFGLTPTNRAVARLLEVLDLRRLGDHVFEGCSFDPAAGHLFGGQILAQAVAAADRADGEVSLHSLHANFLGRGTPAAPLLFEVSELRRSRAFRTQEVLARQGDKLILKMTVSRNDGGAGPEHQAPVVVSGAKPEGETFEAALVRALGGPADSAAEQSEDSHPAQRLAEKMAKSDREAPDSFELPIEIRSAPGMGLFSDIVGPPTAECWMRVRDDIGDDLALHRAVFVYASDYAIMAPAYKPHPFPVTAVESASLDHAVWFHRDFRIDDWLHLSMDSPIASGARATSRGLLHDGDGVLVASCVQEGLIRPFS